MRLIFDPANPVRIRVKYNGSTVYDQLHQPGKHDIDVTHPKSCGKAEAFIVGDDGSETPMGTTDYGTCSTQCSCGGHH